MSSDREGKLRLEAERGRQAADLLGNELLKETLAGVREGIFQEWMSSPRAASEARESLYHELQSVNRLLTALRSVETCGKMATAELETVK